MPCGLAVKIDSIIYPIILPAKVDDNGRGQFVGCQIIVNFCGQNYWVNYRVNFHIFGVKNVIRNYVLLCILP